MALWGSIAASSTQSFNSTFVPQFISFTVTTVPTSFQIVVQGDGVIFNLDGTGVTNMSNIGMVGSPTNTYVFQLADGLINGKNVTVTIANAVASQMDVYYDSFQYGSFYNTFQTQQALANSGILLSKFGYAAFPSAAAADVFQMEFSALNGSNAGVVQTMNRLDLQNLLGFKQNNVNSRYNWFNISPAIMKSITFIPAASQNVYVMWYQSQRGSVNSAVLQR